MPTYKPRSSKWSLSFRFWQQTPVHISLILHICHKPCPAHPPLFHHTHITFCTQWKSQSSALCTFLQPPVTSSFPDLNIFHSILSTNILSLYFSLSVRHFKFQTIIYNSRHYYSSVKTWPTDTYIRNRKTKKLNKFSLWLYCWRCRITLP